jgi:dephospho-CoA kinase
MSTNLVVAFAGRIGAGKSSVSAAFAEERGWKFASFGAFVRKTATERGMDLSRESLQTVGAELEAKDAAKFCRAVLDDAGWNAGEPAVVEGIRHVRILDTLKSQVAPQPVFLVYLEAPEELRRNRLQERGAQEAHYLERTETHSTERDVITELPQLADLVLSTEGAAVADLVRQIKAALSAS